MEKIAGRYTKELFYEANNFSRQYYVKLKQSNHKKEILEQEVISVVKKAREKHKNMGSRSLYYHLKIRHIGINKFEKIISDNNLQLKKKRRRIITTDGYKDARDVNLISGLTLTDINQAISGDITYFIITGKTYYIYTLKDLYSKRILGLYGSDNMLAVSALQALIQAVKFRGNALNNCIHHTDKGVQYRSALYRAMLGKEGRKMRVSIAENCLENGMAEQLNGVLKTDYLEDNVKNVKDLNRQLRKIKKLINEERPVKALKYKTPVEFENWLENTTFRPKIKLYEF